MLKSKFPLVEFESGVSVVAKEDLYKGTDNDMSFLAHLASTRIFSSNKIFSAPVTMGGRWKAEIRNVQQGLVVRHKLNDVKSEEIEFRDTVSLKLDLTCFKTFF